MCILFQMNTTPSYPSPLCSYVSHSSFAFQFVIGVMCNVSIALLCIMWWTTWTWGMLTPSFFFQPLSSTLGWVALPLCVFKLSLHVLLFNSSWQSWSYVVLVLLVVQGKVIRTWGVLHPLVFPNYHLLPSRWVPCLIVLILCTFLHALVFHCGCYDHVGVPHYVMVLPMEEQWTCEKCHLPWWFSTITFLNFLLHYWPTHFQACNDMNYFFQQV